MSKIQNDEVRSAFYPHLRTPSIVEISRSKKSKCRYGSSEQRSSWSNAVVKGSNDLDKEPSIESTLLITASKGRTGTFTYSQIKITRQI